jgi:transcriptional regulator with PAS, ATPase and Fis domain
VSEKEYKGVKHMGEQESTTQLQELVMLAMDCLDVSVTILDKEGTLLYYNRYSAEILERKPEYIGSDIHLHHKKPTTNPKFDAMLQEFSEGRTEPFHYESNPYGKVILVTLILLRKDGQFIGCVQAVRLKKEMNDGS